MLLLVILAAVLAMSAAAAVMVARTRRVRTKGRHRSRYFSISLADTDAPDIPDDRQH